MSSPQSDPANPLPPILRQILLVLAVAGALVGAYLLIGTVGNRIDRGCHHPGAWKTLTEPSGEFKEWCELPDGTRDGPTRAYYPSGQLKMEGQYKDHHLDGVWTNWREDGSKKSELVYDNGVEIEGRLWDEQGRRTY